MEKNASPSPPSDASGGALSAFDVWKQKNPSLIKMIKLTPINDQISKEKFNKRRIECHEKEKQRLVDLSVKLEKLEKEVEAELFETEKKINKQQKEINLYYQDKAQNMQVRVMSFLRYTYIRTLISFISDYLNTVLKRMKDVVSLSSLFLENIIPENEILTFTDELLNLQKNRVLERQYRCLRTKYFVVKKEVESYKDPPYIKNPKSFFKLLKDKAYEEGKKHNLYFNSIPEEIGFSAYLFASPSAEGEKIDKFIEEQEKVDFDGFGDKAISLCHSLIPPSKNADETTISITLFFRQISERAYDRIYPKLPQISNPEVIISYSQKPMCDVLISLASLPPFPPETPLRDGFLFDPLFNSATGWLTDAIFVPCILDVLHYVSLCMRKIWYASMVMQLGREPTDCEMNTIPAFEEMFSLVFGAVLSSDIPDVIQFCTAVTKLAPFSRLSSDLEFAATSIAAVLEHITASCDVKQIVKGRAKDE